MEPLGETAISATIRFQYARKIRHCREHPSRGVQTERPAFFVTRGVAGLTKCGFRLFSEDLFHVAYFALHFAADFFCGAAVP
jgi:hypothetical protein